MALTKLEAIAKIVKTQRPRFLDQKNGFFEGQNLRAYPVFRNFVEKNSKMLPDQNSQYSWNIRPVGDNGSTIAYTPFQSLAYKQTANGVTMTVNRRQTLSFMNMVYDQTMVTKTPENFINMIQQDTSIGYEDYAAYWEKAFIDAPYNTTDENAFLGALYWLGYSQDSSGNYVDQPDPAKNGVYTTLGDGTITALRASLDLSQTTNANARTVVGTYDGTISEGLLRGIKKAGHKLAMYSYLDGLKGEIPGTGQFMILWNDDQDEEYGNLLSSLGGPRGRDYFDNGDTTIASMKTMAVPSFSRLSRKSIIGIDPNVMYLAKTPGQWDIDLEHKIDPLKTAFPKLYGGQILCKHPAVCGFHFHGSW